MVSSYKGRVQFRILILKENANRSLGAGCLALKGIISAVARVEFVTDMGSNTKRSFV